MRKFPHVAVLFAAICGAIVSQAAAGEPPPSAVITTAGEQRLFDGKLVFEITETPKGDHLHFTIRKGQGGCGFPVFAGWRLYPESPTSLWVFDGRDTLQRVTFSPEGISVALARPKSEIIAEAPKAFLRTLPAQFQPQ